MSPVKIVRVEDLHAAGGVRGCVSFLKVTTDEGLVGWSEFNEEMQRPGLAAFPGLTMTIRKVAERVLGLDPRDVAQIDAMLYAGSRIAAGGIAAHANAAIVNACLDLKAKALGVPVCDLLLGGPSRRRIPVYWSHCGTYRVRYGELLGTPPIRSRDDLVKLGHEVVERGFGALKTNLLLWDGGEPESFRGAERGATRGRAEQNVSSRELRGIAETLTAFREGAGPDTGLIIDLNFAYTPEGLRRIVKAVEPFDLLWLEVDLYQPEALARVRWSSSTPIGSLEAVLGVRDFKSYIAAQAVDVAIIDPQYNGLLESMRMAAIAQAWDVNVAAHNAYGQLSILMGAHFCAAVPNLRLMEYDVDQPPWAPELVTDPIVIEDGELVLPAGPGWGTDVDEEAVLGRPPQDVGASTWLLDYHRAHA
jgi:L-alanine-DL-glutamate epimerase-like enolase superfamily enzyme